MKMVEGGGEVKCILFCEFHHTVGPKVVFQAPEDVVTKDEFDAVHVYIITKPELKDHIITINCHRHKILGCPIYIDNKNYARNALIFNVCFVFDTKTNTVPYENVVKKLAGYFTTLEIECGFLSNEVSRERLPGVLDRIRKEINNKGTCHIHINESNAIHLKVAPLHTEPPPVQLHDVPIVCINQRHTKCSQWDLATQQILGYIDGFKHIGRIAAEADVDVNIVKACIQNLVYHETVKLISIFQYSNVYMVTPDINKLCEDEDLQKECIEYVARSGKCPEFHLVFQLYCALCAGATVKDLCLRYNPHSLGVDERKLIHYGLMLGIIRRLHKFPVKLPHEPGSIRLRDLYKYFNGCHSYDEICCITGLSYQELEEKVDSDTGIVVVWK